uniref:Uncharacterized protein n=1 Tax=Ditylum brightwellii TaxID=49249 RepID=A0A7S4S9C6_9STRA
MTLDLTKSSVQDIVRTRTRRLDTSSKSVGLWVGVGIAAAIILGCLAYFIWRRRSRRQKSRRGIKLNDTLDEESNDSASNIDIVESSVSDDDTESNAPLESPTEPKNPTNKTEVEPVSTFRNETISTLDVHKCKSGSCEHCRKKKEPSFLTVEQGQEQVISYPPPKKKWWLQV